MSRIQHLENSSVFKLLNTTKELKKATTYSKIGLRPHWDGIPDNDTKRKNNIIEPNEVINDELLSQLVDEMISSHIKDFIRNYIKKEMGMDYNVGGLEFDGNLLF